MHSFLLVEKRVNMSVCRYVVSCLLAPCVCLCVCACLGEEAGCMFLYQIFYLVCVYVSIVYVCPRAQTYTYTCTNTYIHTRTRTHTQHNEVKRPSHLCLAQLNVLLTRFVNGLRFPVLLWDSILHLHAHMVVIEIRRDCKHMVGECRGHAMYGCVYAFLCMCNVYTVLLSA